MMAENKDKTVMGAKGEGSCLCGKELSREEGVVGVKAEGISVLSTGL